MISDDLSVIFIVEGENLQAQSVLLAATLKTHLAQGTRKIAYVPEHYIDKLYPEVLQVYQRCGVEVAPLPKLSQEWRKPYPHGNKIIACTAPRTTSATVFLDTDIVLAKTPDFEELLKDVTVALVPEGTPTWSKDQERWERAYAFFDLPYPKERVQLVRRRRIEFVPYFNAGMVAFKDVEIQDGKHFGHLWLETAMEFDHRAPIGGKRPWLDQITLPLTLKRFDVPYRVASELYNFSISSRIFQDGLEPSIVHYHRWGYLRAWPHYLATHQALLEVCGPVLAMELRARFDAIWSASV